MWLKIMFILHPQWYTGYFVVIHHVGESTLHAISVGLQLLQNIQKWTLFIFEAQQQHCSSKADPRRILLEQFLYLLPTLMQQWLLALRCYKSGWLATPNPLAQRCYVSRSHSVFRDHKKNLGKSPKPFPFSEKNQLHLAIFFLSEVCLSWFLKSTAMEMSKLPQVTYTGLNSIYHQWVFLDI